MTKRDEIQQEAINTALLHNNGTLDISVRVGKTKIGLEIASKFKNVLVNFMNYLRFISYMDNKKI